MLHALNHRCCKTRFRPSSSPDAANDNADTQSETSEVAYTHHGSQIFVVFKMIISEELFSHSLSRLFKSGIPSKVAIALSGGPDSMLLTWLLQQHKRHQNSFDIYAITIDHRYRAGSHKEAMKVHEWVKDWKINHIIQTLEYKDNADPSSMSNFEEIAREERYKVFSKFCTKESIPVLFMGHHRDDQLETFIQRLQGNSSIFGLAGTRSISSLPTSKDLSPTDSMTSDNFQVQIVRPFWEYDKADIVDTCKADSVPFVTDPTNRDVSLTRRNYLRHLIGEVIPKKCGDPYEDKQTGIVTPNSPYSLIARSELIKLHSLCHEFAELFEYKAQELSDHLHKEGLIKEYPHLGALEIELPRKCLEGTNGIVTSRFLYRILHPYSTLKHYHWAYAKLERQLIPRIAKFLEQGNPGTFKMTMMNLVFEVTNNVHSDLIPIKIYRCPIVTKGASEIEEDLNIGKEWSDWKLFDNRFWIRARSKTFLSQIRIVPYAPKLHKRMIEEKLLGEFEPKHFHETLPVFMEEKSQKIIAFPTLSYTSPNIELDIQWRQKNNRFKYCEQPTWRNNNLVNK